MDKNEREKFIRIQIPMYRLTCRRSNQYGDEWLIAVARLGNKLIVFDDVEDEFGIVISSGDSHEVFHDWRLFGTLENALKEIHQIDGPKLD